jgi:hypothetical protein
MLCHAELREVDAMHSWISLLLAVFIMSWLAAKMPAESQERVPKKGAEAATPLSGELMSAKASDWTHASTSDKETLALAVFATPFPKRARMWPSALIACLDDQAAKASAKTLVKSLVKKCTE